MHNKKWPWMDPEITNNPKKQCRRHPKSDAKRKNIKNEKNHTHPILGPTWSKIGSQKRWCPASKIEKSTFFARLVPETSEKLPDPKNITKLLERYNICVILSMHSRNCCSICVAWQVEFTAEVIAIILALTRCSPCSPMGSLVSPMFPRVPQEGGLLQGWESVCWWVVGIYQDSKISISQDVPNVSTSQGFGVIDSPRCTKIPKVNLPKCIKISRIIHKYPTRIKHFSNYFRFTGIHRYFNIIKLYSRFQRFYKDSTMLTFHLFWNHRQSQLFLAHQNLIWFHHTFRKFQPWPSGLS